MSETPRRKVAIAVRSWSATPDELRELLGDLAPDDVQLAKIGVSYAVFRSRVGATEPLESHLQDLWETATRLIDVVSVSESKSIQCVLSIMHVVGPDDEFPGLHLDAPWVKVLAGLGGEIDVDLYVEAPG